MELSGVKIGYALTGSFCTLKKSFEVMEEIVKNGGDVYPIMSENVYYTDTRFGTAESFIKRAEEICKKEVMHLIRETEVIGPENMLDVLVVAPCTGNTLGKVANGVNDTAVTMAIKATLRNQKPVVLGVSTNDGLSGSAKNIGMALNFKNIYFVPFFQDDYLKKPNSLIAKFDLLVPAVKSALRGVQLQPLLY